MEDTLRGNEKFSIRGILTSLNPCFNGRYSQSNYNHSYPMDKRSLNPCFNGRYSQRFYDDYEKDLEGSLNPCFNGRYSQSSSCLMAR